MLNRKSSFLLRPTHSLLSAALLATAIFAVSAHAQPDSVADSVVMTPLEPLRHGMTEEQLFTQVDAHNEQRKSALTDYTVHRTYQVVDLKGKVHAEEIGQMEYHAPDKKSFVLASESGSGIVRRMALSRLISSEVEAAAGKERRDSALSPANYTLHLLGEQQVGPYRCFAAQAIPKREDKYLYAGTVWIDVNDFAVVRIEGRPAKKLSFWVQKADFVRQYQKLGDFWLPQRDETLVQIRLYGKKILTIAHEHYVVNGVQQREDSAPIQEARMHLTRAHR